MGCEGARHIGEFAFGMNPGTGGRNQSVLHGDLGCNLRDGGEAQVDGQLFAKDGRSRFEGGCIMQRSKSNVLLVTICSNHKVEGGDRTYDAANIVRHALSREVARQLYEGRRTIRTLLTRDDVARDGRLIRKLPLAMHLVDGPDFHRSECEPEGRYLPAAQRYYGGFYRELGKDRLSILTNTPHHVVIVSGLCGLLTPREPIQSYSCHVSDHPDIARTWTEEDRLTEILLEYIKRFSITKVFDFTGDDKYRRLISWEKVRHATRGDVLYCFSEQYAGAALLPSLGTLMKKFLAEPEARLLTIQPKHHEPVADDPPVLFERFPVPESPDIAVEIQRQMVRLSTADKIGRMRRNISAILRSLARPHDRTFGFVERVNTFESQRRLAPEIARLMREFAAVRNDVEYRGRVIRDVEWRGIRHKYDTIERWANSNGLIGETALEKVDS